MSEVLVTLVVGFAVLFGVLTAYELLGWKKEDKKEAQELTA